MVGSGDGRRERAAALLADHDRRLLRLAEELPFPLWAAPSLCAGWTNHEVLAHLVDGVGSRATDVIGDLWRAGGDFHRANHRRARELAARRSPTELARAFDRWRQGRRGAARLLPPVVLLADHVTHHLDIALAVGAEVGPAVDLDPLAAQRVLGLTRLPSPFVPAARIGRSLELSAPDIGWRQRGDRDLLVEGRAVDLISVLAGRPHRLDRLRGPGVSLLRRRIGAAAPADAEVQR